MKVQDVIFLIVLAVVIFRRFPKITISAGIFCLLLAVPLYARWVFFTAERLVLYAAVFFLLGALQLLFEKKK